MVERVGPSLGIQDLREVVAEVDRRREWGEAESLEDWPRHLSGLDGQRRCVALNCGGPAGVDECGVDADPACVWHDRSSGEVDAGLEEASERRADRFPAAQGKEEADRKPPLLVHVEGEVAHVGPRRTSPIRQRGDAHRDDRETHDVDQLSAALKRRC